MRAIALLAAITAMPASSVMAQEPDRETPRRFAVGVQAGTPGLGFQAQYSINDYVVLRGGYDVLQWQTDDTYDGVDYDADIDFQSPGAFIDLDPFKNGLFVSGGAYFGDRSIDLDATPTENVNIGGAIFTPEQVGRLSGRIDLENTAPFLGLGYDDTFSRDRRFGFRVLAGAAFGDSPRVNLNASGGTLSDQPLLQERLAQEERQIQEDADDYKILPVVQIGLNYRF